MRNRPLLTLCLIVLTALTSSGCKNGNSNSAEVRILNVSSGYSSLDMYVNNGDNSSDTLELQAATSGAVSNYASLDSGTYTVKFKVHSGSDTLTTLSSEKLTDESHVTYIAYGSTGHFVVTSINEDHGDPDSGKSLVQVYNTAEAGDLDVYLTDSSTSLSDTSPTLSSISSGGATSTTIDHGTYRLRVTGAGDKTDLRLDVASITFNDQKVSSLVLTSTQGGVLVNAVYLPQQGSLTTFNNTKARIRGAVGIADGTTVTASVGGVSLLNNTTVGVMGSSYAQVDGGTVSVSLSVDGNPVSVSDQTLTAGGDYTLLVWSNANGTQTTFISDDNHIPHTSSKTKLRLLNGMSGLGSALTLNANFSPVAEGVSVGQASTASEIDGGSDYELDVVNATNGATLLSKTPVTLTAGNVYTLFMSGGGTATVIGNLHKDR
jgi:hypothetical protein